MNVPKKDGKKSRQVTEKANKTSNPSHSPKAQPSPYGVIPPGSSPSALEKAPKGRRRGRPTTREVPTSAARGILDAADFSIAVGLPFNRFVTIHWDAGHVVDDQAATARFLKLASDWVRVHGGVLAFAWVRENGFGKGRHVHILMHLPINLTDGYNRRQRGWLAQCGAIWRKGVVCTRPVGINAEQALKGGPHYERNLAEVVDYILKGADDQARTTLAIRRRQDGGSIVGKRCGFSQNLGPTARRRHRSR